jgi:hypothetical protein
MTRLTERQRSLLRRAARSTEDAIDDIDREVAAFLDWSDPHARKIRDITAGLFQAVVDVRLVINMSLPDEEPTP